MTSIFFKKTFLISLSTGAQPRSVEKAILIDDKSEGMRSAGRENEFRDEKISLLFISTIPCNNK